MPDNLDLDPALLEPVAKPLTAPGEFAACLNQLGTYTTEHFVLRLSPRVHELVDAISSGVNVSGEIDGETVQAYSTYLHETIHWWQHIGSTSGLILSLTYPAQAHQNVEHLEKVLKLVGPKKSLKRWAEDAARAGLTDEDPGLRAANMAVNNAVDAEFYKIATVMPTLIPQAMQDPYFETVGHCYWMAYTHAVGLLAATVDRDWSQLPDPAVWQERFIRKAGRLVSHGGAGCSPGIACVVRGPSAHDPIAIPDVRNDQSSYDGNVEGCRLFQGRVRGSLRRIS